MAFRLPMQNKIVKNQGRFTHSNEEAAPGTPIIRKDLAPGIMAEANDDGTIFDDMIMWNGNNYQRLDDGKVMFEGKKYNEGDKNLPWEAVAM